MSFSARIAKRSSTCSPTWSASRCAARISNAARSSRSSRRREIEPPKSDPVPVPPPRPLPPESAAPKTKKRDKSKPQPQPAVVDAQIVEAAIVAPPKVKEVVWSEGTDAAAGAKKPMQAEFLDETDEQPILRRKKKKSRGPWILIGMSAAIVLVVGFGILFILRFQDQTEKNLAKQADEEYKKGDYASASRSFEKLAAEYPTSDEQPRYAFFADLSGMQVVVRSVTNRENPDAAVERLKKLIATQKDSPFAKHTSGFGRDILEAGKKLGEDVAGHADDRVKAFRADRSGKPGELERADKAVATGRELLPLLEPFPRRTIRRSTRSAAISTASRPTSSANANGPSPSRRPLRNWKRSRTRPFRKSRTNWPRPGSTKTPKRCR